MSKLYTLTVKMQPNVINFRPASVVEEILQNVNTIVSTVIYSVPLNRGFGVDASFVDEPTPVVKARLIAEISEKVERYESRVTVEEVIVKANLDGQLIPTLKFSIRNGVAV